MPDQLLPIAKARGYQLKSTKQEGVFIRQAVYHEYANMFYVDRLNLMDREMYFIVSFHLMREAIVQNEHHSY